MSSVPTVSLNGYDHTQVRGVPTVSDWHILSVLTSKIGWGQTHGREFSSARGRSKANRLGLPRCP